ncbi:hypothetical protein GALMADRAFT_1113897 [Galerina marginata CBS 339.88]|uniref:Uncharacterized protein n=1 Tax=Galerina marginata (strain CBS 339.88) TaxID=685588 RepID=A0A067TEX4_GALM3|nr:hypothetical protein GALMADRAFT_1113897 [Galerina marginata CBS 339.88]
MSKVHDQAPRDVAPADGTHTEPIKPRDTVLDAFRRWFLCEFSTVKHAWVVVGINTPVWVLDRVLRHARLRGRVCRQSMDLF